MTNSPKLNVLIASYLEPDLVATIRHEVPDVEVLYEPELLGKPTYPCDHTSILERTEEEERMWRALIKRADVMFDFDYTHKEDLPQVAPNVRWIQATSAGIGQFVKRFGYDRRTSWIFTTASGVHARPLAEFVIMSMLMFTKDAFYLQAEKSRHHWQRYCGAELSGKRLAIVGLGKVGREVARYAKTFDMQVLGNRRSSNKTSIPYVDKVFSRDELPQMLERADFLTLSCPLTSETEGLIGREELEMLPTGSVLINISRGAVVNQRALAEALKSGHLRGAALDVFEIEPLPSDDPLWKMPNVIISPHSASTALDENRKLTSLFCENLKRYLTNKPLLNVFDTAKGY